MKKPRPYQKVIIEKAVDELSRKDRATVVMPCASGKTLTALWIIERMEAKNVVVFVPTLGLLAQAAREFLTNTKYRDVGCLAICSDTNVVKGIDEILPDPEELPFIVTDRVSVVQEYLKVDGSPVKFLFCTYHSSDILGLALQRSGITLDFAFFDEAHRTAGRLGAPFTYILLNENLPVYKRLFMTATLRVYSFINTAYANAHSMDNSSSFGRICAMMSFSEAVELGIICSYKVIVSVVDTSSLQLELLYDGEVTGEEIPARDAAIRESISKALEKYGAKKVIIYHTTIEQAENFASRVLKDYIRGYEILHINSGMTGIQRHNIMERFRNSERAIITNARCLTEGIDVPAVDLVVFADPKHSEIDIVQAIGRAMRISEGKTTGYVLLPLFLDKRSGESINEALFRCNYETVWSVLNTLSSVDEGFESWMALYRRNWGMEGMLFGGPDIIEVLTPPGVDARRIQESVGIFIVRRLSDVWEERYGELLRFKSEHGHIDLPYRTQLRQWLRSQRQRWKYLTPERQKLLLEIGFDPNIITKETIWMEKFEELQAFKKQHGHIVVPSINKLYYWLSRQKQYFKVLTSEKQKLLLEMGFNPNIISVETRWTERFEELRAFKKQNGHIRVPQNTKLSNWLKTQKQSWKNLTSEKRNLLLEIGYDPTIIFNEKRFMENLEELRTYKKQHGHIKGSSQQFDSWFRSLRTRWNVLSPEKRELLLELGFDPNPTDSLWENKLKKLEAYAKEHGHCNVKNSDSKSLSHYITLARRAYQEGRLPPDRIEALERLGISWGIGWERLFEDIYRQLADYLAEHGCLPSYYSTLSEEKLLIGRVVNLRKLYHAGKLSDENIRRLKELDFSFSPVEERWQKRYRELEEYVLKGGDPNRIHCKNHLRGWVHGVIKIYKKGRLSQDKVELMEKLGVIWDDEGYLNEKWQKYFQSVAEYFEKNGIHTLPETHPVYSWWTDQLKYIYKLPQEKAEKIRSLRPIRPTRRWSEPEKTLIRENPNKTAEELSQALIGRSPKAIQELRDKYGW